MRSRGAWVSQAWRRLHLPWQTPFSLPRGSGYGGYHCALAIPRKAQRRSSMKIKRGSAFVWSALFAVLVLSAGGIALSVTPSSAASSAEGVPAFETIRAVLQHPRCQNCHIPGDAPLQFDEGRVHSLNVLRGPDGKGAPGLPCATCHAG